MEENIWKSLPRGLQLAIREAEKSDNRFQMGSVCMKGNRVLSRGHNQIRFKSIGASKYSLFKGSLHAERDCLSKVGKEDLKGATVYVARAFADGKPALAAPCAQCLFMIEDLNISKIVFTIPESPYYEEMKL